MQDKTGDYTVKIYNIDIKMSEYVDNYFDRDKVHDLCKRCNKYGTLWSCPPYDFIIEDYLNKYKYVHLIGTQISLSSKLIGETKKEDILDCTYKILNNVRKKLEEMLLGLENVYPDSISLYAGSCINCDVCERMQNKPCIHPETMRYSLESLGFDVSKTASSLLNIEIKWAEESLPEYFTLVSAFFTNEKINNISVGWS